MVFELSPSGSGWSYNLLYAFAETGSNRNGGPAATLTMDAAGNLYGTTVEDGPNGAGTVFRLTHTQGGWVYTSLYNFTGGSDGSYPFGNVIFDSNGNMYGTTTEGGVYGYGTVWEITP